MQTQKEERAEAKTASRVLSVLSIVLCVILALVLVGNLVIIIKGTVTPNEPPSIFGIVPLVVLSGSMEGENPDSFPAGSLVVMRHVDASTLEAGDVIAFHEKGSDTAIVSHRILEVKNENGTLSFVTKGDANNTQDRSEVQAGEVVGVYCFHIAKIGDFALFLQEPLGMLLFIGLPVIGFILYDLMRRKKTAQKENTKAAELEDKTAALEAEVARLRALAAEKESGESTEEAPKTEALPSVTDDRLAPTEVMEGNDNQSGEA